MTPEEMTFERERTAYEQNCDHFRSLNQIMWQVPLITMTLTGGLWFAATGTGALPEARPALFMLAGIGDIALWIVLLRVRFVMERHLEKMRQFSPANFVEASSGSRPWHRSRTVVAAFGVLMFVAAVLSFVLAHRAYKVLPGVV